MGYFTLLFLKPSLGLIFVIIIIFLFLDYYEPEIEMNDEDQGEFSLPEVDFKKEEELWVKSPYLDQKPPQLENEKRAPKHTFPKLIAEALFKVLFIYYVSTLVTKNSI